MEKREQKKFISKVIIVAFAVLMVVYIKTTMKFAGILLDILFPFILGMGVAYIVNLIMRFIEDKIFGKIKNKFFIRIKRPLSILLTILLIVTVIALVLYLVIPQMIASITIIVESVPKLISNVYNWIQNHPGNEFINEIISERINDLQTNWEAYTSNILSFLRNNIGGFVGTTFGFINSIFGTFYTMFVIFIFSLYLLAGKEKIGGQVNAAMDAYIPDKQLTNIRYFFEVMDEKFASFFKGQVLDAVIIGTILYVALLITKMPYALTIAIVVMVTALIPMLGAFIGGAIGFIMIAALNFRQGLVFILILVIVQQLEGDLIYPKLVGDSVGLPGIWTFAAVIIGGAIAGPIGMLLFVPLTAGIYQILQTDVKKRRMEKKNKTVYEIKEGNIIS